MKRFLLKVLFFLSIFLLTASAIVFYYKKKVDLPFFSNSISYNAKAKFILQHQDQVKKDSFFVIGSSMDLNNMDCMLLSDSIHQGVINLSSWAMKLKDFSDFDIWRPNATILLNVYFTDFGTSSINKKIGQPYSSSTFLDFINILSDFQTYRIQSSDFIHDSKAEKNDFYQSVKFDSSGSVIFTERDIFKIDSGRWNGFVSHVPDEELKAFAQEVRERSKLVKKFIITLSPARPCMHISDKSNSAKALEQYLGNIPNAVFFNNYEVPGFTDDHFVDNCHFSNKGAKKYAAIILSQLKTIGY